MLRMKRAVQYSTPMHFRMTTAEARKLARLAKHYERTASDVLRRLIVEAHARLATPTETKEG